MRVRSGLLLQVSQIHQAELTYHFWGSRNSGVELHGRQDGYDPEFGTCGIGQTCAEACGDDFEACTAINTSVLFCYNPAAGQTCCPGGSGRACDVGFYCVNDPNGGQTYCCDGDSDLSQCASELGISTVVSTTATTSSTRNPVTVTTSSTPWTTHGTSATTTTTTTTAVATTPASGGLPTLTATLTTSSSNNSTVTGPATSSIVTAGASSSRDALQAWGIGVMLVRWAVMVW